MVSDQDLPEKINGIFPFNDPQILSNLHISISQRNVMASPKVHLGPGGGSRWDAGLGPHCHAALPADLADVRGGRQIWRQGPGEVARAGAWDDDDGMGGNL